MRKNVFIAWYLFLILVAKNSFGVSDSTLNVSLEKNKGLQLGDSL